MEVYAIGGTQTKLARSNFRLYGYMQKKRFTLAFGNS